MYSGILGLSKEGWREEYSSTLRNGKTIYVISGVLDE